MPVIIYEIQCLSPKINVWVKLYLPMVTVWWGIWKQASLVVIFPWMVAIAQIHASPCRKGYRVETSLSTCNFQVLCIWQTLVNAEWCLNTVHGVFYVCASKGPSPLNGLLPQSLYSPFKLFRINPFLLYSWKDKSLSWKRPTSKCKMIESLCLEASKVSSWEILIFCIFFFVVFLIVLSY